VDWNIKNGSLAFRLAGGTVSNNVAGWAGGLSFPDIAFDSRGDFNQTITLPGFTFDGISLGLAADSSDRYVTFKRKNGVLSMSLRDKQDFFDGSASVGFDFDSNAHVSGFFSAAFGADFGWPIGYVPFGSVSTSYDSSRTPYQFLGDLNIAGNDFRVKFGSGGASVCHLICGPTGCAETICLP
jgi:hypothetical protein